jgi:hypothetical protein
MKHEGTNPSVDAPENPLLAGVVRVGEECVDRYAPAVESTTPQTLDSVVQLGLELHEQLLQAARAWGAPIRAAGVDAYDLSQGAAVQQAYRRWYYPTRKLLAALEPSPAATPDSADAIERLRHACERAAYAAEMDLPVVLAGYKQIAGPRSAAHGTQPASHAGAGHV